MISAITTIWDPIGWDAQRDHLVKLLDAGELGDVTVVQVNGTASPAVLPDARFSLLLGSPDAIEPYSIWNNKAIPKLAGDFVLHLNGDILPVPGSVPLMEAWLKANPSAAMIGGDYWFGEVGTAEKATPQCDEILTVMEAGLMLSQYGLFSKALWGVVKFEESGPFATRGWGLEDNDLGCQLRSLGATIWMIQDVMCAGVKQQMRYAHLGLGPGITDGVHGSGERMEKAGIDVKAARLARWAYCDKKWGGQKLDGRPWDWERADDYAGPGRYSLRAVVELSKPGGDAFECKLHPALTSEYLLEP